MLSMLLVYASLAATAIVGGTAVRAVVRTAKANKAPKKSAKLMSKIETSANHTTTKAKQKRKFVKYKKRENSKHKRLPLELRVNSFVRRLGVNQADFSDLLEMDAYAGRKDTLRKLNRAKVGLLHAQLKDKRFKICKLQKKINKLDDPTQTLGFIESSTKVPGSHYLKKLFDIEYGKGKRKGETEVVDPRFSMVASEFKKSGVNPNVVFAKLLDENWKKEAQENSKRTKRDKSAYVRTDEPEFVRFNIDYPTRTGYGPDRFVLGCEDTTSTLYIASKLLMIANAYAKFKENPDMKVRVIEGKYGEEQCRVIDKKEFDTYVKSELMNPTINVALRAIKEVDEKAKNFVIGQVKGGLARAQHVTK